MVALDTETTGLDLHHGAKPYLVTVCKDDGDVAWWEWDVNPLTREPTVPGSDLAEVREVIDRARRWGTFAGDVRERHVLVLQNPKFDVTALARIGVGDWPWDMTRDTLLAGHLLHSSQPHDLTSMTLLYLGVDVQPYEDRLRDACLEARRLARSKLPEWKLAKDGVDGMPSAKGGSSDKRVKGAETGSTWKFDAWLPRAICRFADEQLRSYGGSQASPAACWDAYFKTTKAKAKPFWSAYADPNHPWRTVCSDYANSDSCVTAALWPVLKAELEKKGLWSHYLDRLRVLPVIWGMEQRGVTYSARRLEELVDQYSSEAHAAADACVEIAAHHGHGLTLPKSGNNKSLLSFVFDKDKLALPPFIWTDGGSPAFNKEALEHYADVLPEGSGGQKFIRALQGKRRRDTALNYLAGYKRFSKRVQPRLGEEAKLWDDWRILHPNVNPTGTDTLRFSSNNPNSQNVSKKEGFNLRYCFGPGPGREWWAFDGENMELRVAAYESGEEEFIKLFERPHEPPYFGSNHLLIAALLFPREFEGCLSCRRCKREVRAAGLTPADVDCCTCAGADGLVDGRLFKSRYSATLYDRIKRGNFAVQYGAQERKADSTYGVSGSYRRIKERFSKQDALNKGWVNFAERRGFVETLPERDVDPSRGFPIMCQRGPYGKIEPTKPFSYHIQGTVSRWMEKSIVRVDEQLKRWRDEGKGTDRRFEGFITLTVHDELVLDFPKKADPFKNPKGSNLWRALRIAQIMEDVGRDFVVSGRSNGVPIKVSTSYCPETYSDGLPIKMSAVPSAHRETNVAHGTGGEGATNGTVERKSGSSSAGSQGALRRGLGQKISARGR